MTIQVMDRLHS